MNGTTRPVKDNDVVNKPPTFSLSTKESEEDTSCKIENNTSCEGSKGKWKKGLNIIGNNLEGECKFEFRKVCKRSVSEITSFNLIIDAGLPDINLPVGDLTASR